MNLTLLCAVVVVQVVAFQYVAIRLSRALPDLVIGAAGLPEPVAARVESCKHAGRLRSALGAGLCLLALLATFVLPLGYAACKMTLAGVSLASSLILAAGYVRDRRAVAALAALLPEPALRAATLERRTLDAYYAPIWETVPPAILLATAGLTVWAASRAPLAAERLGGLALWILPIVQVLFVGGMFLLALRRVQGAGCLPQRAGNFRPEEALRLDRELRALEIRQLLFSRVGLTLLLGLMQARYAARVVDGRPHVGLGASQWGLLVILLVQFAVYVVRTARLRQTQARQAASKTKEGSNETKTIVAREH